MLKYFFIIVLILCSSVSFAQYYDTYQPNAFYRDNKIKQVTILYDYNRWKTRIVRKFDRSGLLQQETHYDTTGLKKISDFKWVFDSIKLVSITRIYYTHFDTLTKKEEFNIKPRVNIQKFQFDTVNNIRTSKEYNDSGKLVLKTTMDYKKHESLETCYNNDSVSFSVKVFYDRPSIEKSIHFEFKNSDAKFPFIEYNYKNKFDKAGRILKRTVSADYTETNEKLIFDKEMEYEYTRNGFLMYRTTTLSDGKIYRLIFSYEFWD